MLPRPTLRRRTLDVLAGESLPAPTSHARSSLSKKAWFQQVSEACPPLQGSLTEWGRSKYYFPSKRFSSNPHIQDYQRQKERLLGRSTDDDAERRMVAFLGACARPHDEDGAGTLQDASQGAERADGERADGARADLAPFAAWLRTPKRLSDAALY